jgi:hypothetical protein
MFFCAACLAEYLEISFDDLPDLVEQFKELGCTLFMQRRSTMNVFYIPIHFHEREDDPDSLVALVTNQDIGPCELDELLAEEARNHQYRSYTTQEDMVDAILNSVAKQTGALWSYCDTQNTLCFGDFDEDPEERETRAVDISELAALLINLKKGETLDFTLTPVEPDDDDAEVFSATMVKEFNSFMILINRYDGGVPCAIDITTYQTDLAHIRDELIEYFKYKDSLVATVYVDEHFAQVLDDRK